MDREQLPPHTDEWQAASSPDDHIMELKVWVDGVQRIVCGVTEVTTCQEVVIALAQAIGELGRSEPQRVLLWRSDGSFQPWVNLHARV